MSTAGITENLRQTWQRIGKYAKPSIERMSATWSDCKRVMWNTRNTMYIVGAITMLTMVTLVMSWNRNLVVFLVGVNTIMTTYGALLISKQSCFSILDKNLSCNVQFNDRDREDHK